MSFSPHQMRRLREIVVSLRETDFGRRWPEEYQNLYRLWGYFNRCYDVLYDDPAEWVRVARIALDPRFQDLSQRLVHSQSLRRLAELPCIGDGRSNYEPQAHIRVAFRTLRETFNIPVDQVCSDPICINRQQQEWEICREYFWSNHPSEITRPQDAVYTLVGATLAITYQIRNNLFHGAKMQISERDIELVRLAADIVREILEEVAAIVNGSASRLTSAST